MKSVSKPRGVTKKLVYKKTQKARSWKDDALVPHTPADGMLVRQQAIKFDRV